MISYLFFSFISLALLLIVYRFFLEKEKRFIFNRAFLLWSLVFSFIIPMIPVGLAPLEIPWSALFSSGETVSATNYQNLEGLMMDSEIEPTVLENNSSVMSSDTFFTIAFLLYVSISALLFLRLIRIISRIQLTINRNPKRYIHGCEVVLLKEKTMPHTFFNTVFLNKKQFEKGEIPDEVLNHELTHVRQKHSLDIVFIEFLKTIFWFNPLLYIYKNAIALNHEYLADEAVISQGTIIKNYQQMLLKTLEGNSIHSLASSFNFSLTKRRLQMMTQTKTKAKFLIKIALLVPLFTGLSLMLGCEPASNEIPSNIETSGELKIEILADNTLLVNKNRMTLDELENQLSEMTESPGLVGMEVSPNAQFGVVTDVQNILRKYETSLINYSSQGNGDAENLNSTTTTLKDTLPPPPPPKPNTPSVEMTPEEKVAFEEATAVFQKVYQEYMRLDPKVSDFEELETAYKKVKEAASKIGEVYQNIADRKEEVIPPMPIKIGPDPERRKLLNGKNAESLKFKMEKTLEEWQQKWNIYWEIEPLESNLDKLQEAYKTAASFNEKFNEAQSAYYDSIGKQAPPLPPLPPNPETRIENP